jgi:hypothetical protein
MSHILSWNSSSWNSESAKQLLLSLQKNKLQSNETREHVGLILSWMDLRQSIPKSPSQEKSEKKNTESNPPKSSQISKDDVSSRSESDPGQSKRLSDVSSPRDSLRLDTDLMLSLANHNGSFLFAIYS